MDRGDDAVLSCPVGVEGATCGAELMPGGAERFPSGAELVLGGVERFLNGAELMPGGADGGLSGAALMPWYAVELPASTVRLRVGSEELRGYSAG